MIPGFSGAVIAPSDPGYDEARAVWNVMHDRRPVAVARCQSPADVAAGIAYAGAEGLTIAVRGGGHSLPGHSTVAGGLVLDLRAINHIDVDPAARTVRVGGGATLDSLLSAEVVLADGRVVRATGDEHPDLFWALRGGGGNFGVVTEFLFRAHELSMLPILATFNPLERAPEVLRMGERMMRDPQTPDALLWTSFLRRGPGFAPWMPDALAGTRGRGGSCR